MIKVGMNFVTEPAQAGGEGRRIYTKSFDMPAVPHQFDRISDLAMGGDDLGVIGGTVTSVTWVFVVDGWMAYIDVQTAVPFDDHSHDAA